MHSRTTYEDETVIQMMTDDSPIELKHGRIASYHATRRYDHTLLSVSNTWHQIIVHHKKKYNKKHIIDAFYEIVGDDEFYPVAYREYQFRDKFLIRQCRVAIQKLFDKSLTLNMPMGDTIQLTFKFNAADYRFGQIYPAKKIEKAVEKQFEKLETIEGVTNILNLDKLSSHQELSDVIINLANKAAFDLLCKIITQNHEILNEINGLTLCHNNISSLASMDAFSDVTFRLLDLRSNNIKQISQFKFLKNIKISDLYVSDNPVTSKRGYKEHIKYLLPCIIKLDETHSYAKTNKRDTISSESVEITFEGELITTCIGAMFKKYNMSDKWHQIIIIHNGGYSKPQILDALFDVCEIYPCYYENGPSEDRFLVRKAFDQMEILQKNNMQLQMPNTNEYVQVIFRMNIANFQKGQAEPNELITSAITERFYIMDRLLDLENFCSSKSLNNIEMTLSDSKILASVLMQSGRRYLDNVVELRLRNNNIISGKGMHPLNWMKNLKVLDLSNNNLKSIYELENIPKNTIKEIRLNGNPLCKNYSFSEDYIKDVKKVFSELTYLDGVALSSDNSVTVQKNFLCSIDAYDFVEQFANSYFTIYDSIQRTKLIDMYDENAIFSMSFHYDTKRVSSHNLSRINKYLSRSKNIKKMVNLSRAYTSMHVGKDDISAMFKYLPKTEHDFMSFTIDTTQFNMKCVCITVTGIFKELSTNFMENDLAFAFARTFILHLKAQNHGVSKNTSEYKIVNEIYYISDCTVQQTRNAFKYSKIEESLSIEAITSENKECFIIMFQEITSLKTIWCTRCLEDAAWNFKKALHIFMEMIMKNSIPENSFIEGQQIVAI